MINKVILVGNLGQDPELRTTQGGTQVCKLRIATTERRKVKDNWEDHTEWHSVVTFGRTAENAGKYLKKGRQVYVEGSLQTRKWQDKTGQDRWTTEIVADIIRFLGSGGGSGEARRESPPTDSYDNYGRAESSGQDFTPPFDEGGDVPF